MFRIKGNIWIETDKGTFLGYGRAVLLEKIHEKGSITEAAKTMKMSYRHAWEQIDKMNRLAPEPLVEASAGGAGGGGTRLTTYGIKVLDEFRRIQKKFKEFKEKETTNVRF